MNRLINILKRIFKKRISNKNIICFDEWKDQLLYHKKKVFWLDKNGTNHFLWARTPLIKEDGSIDYKSLELINKENEIKFYKYILEHRIELLTK
jgi:hypothetical protein